MYSLNVACLKGEDKVGREYEGYEIREKDGTEFGVHNTVYLATLQEIRMGYAYFGVRINQIKPLKLCWQAPRTIQDRSVGDGLAMPCCGS
jgi:hypothetical protein